MFKFCIHKYGKWIRKKRRVPAAYLHYQERKCEKCGKTQVEDLFEESLKLNEL